VGQTAKCYHIRHKREARAARRWQAADDREEISSSRAFGIILDLFACIGTPVQRGIAIADASVVLRAPHDSEELKDVLQRVEAWPEAAQAELAELALEIDAGLGAGRYHATPEELAGIDRGLKAAREGRFATDAQIEELFKKHRPA
jgi:predicted transcriptional regulator